jgi:hypothetical protein
MLTPWVIEEMKNADLQDRRLNKRLAMVLEMLSQRPGKSIPTACDGGHAETTGAYRLFDNSKASFEDILVSHIDATLERISQQDQVIVAQDTTEIDLTRPGQQVKGAGLLDGNARYGEFLHPLMGFTPDGTPLGTMYAELWTRDDESSDTSDRKHIPIEEKESVRWLDTQRYAQEVAREIPQTHFISVADSEADIFEVIEVTHESPENFDWVIRACQNRGLLHSEKPEKHSDENHCLASLLRERVQQEPVRFVQSISVRGRESKVSCETRGRRQPQQSRESEVEVRATTVTLRAPWRHDRQLKATTLNAVLVSELNPPKGDTPVEWILLTSLPIESEEEVLSIIRYYCARWMIEVYFRTLKSNCRIETLRFEDLERFERCLAVYMIVAWRTLYTVRLGREYPDLDCEAIFEPDEWRSVYRVVKNEDPPSTPPRLQEMIRMIAQLGGYIDRPRADEPGPQTVGLGMQRMYDITRCWRLFGPDTRVKNQDLTCV